MIDKLKKIISTRYVVGVVLSILIAVLSESSIFPNTTYQKILWTLMAIIGIVVVVANKSYEITKKAMIITIGVAAPFILASIYTLVYRLIVGDNMGVSSQAITTTGFIIVDLLMVLALLFVWKKDAIDVMCRAVIFSYVITLVRSFILVGFGRFWQYLFMRDEFPDWHFSGYYERHDIGVAVVPFLLYYLYKILRRDECIKKIDVVRMILLVFILFMCGKRSAMLGLLFGVLLVVLYRFVNKRYHHYINIFVLGFTLVSAFLYVCLIKFGVLEQIANMFGINSMGRLTVYDWFSNQYQISPLYLGKGFQYVHRYMVLGMGSELVNKFSYLHNSILQIYIEAGFVGFFVWMGIVLGVVPAIIKKYIKKDACEFYICLIISMIAMCAVDNVLTYPVYLVCEYLVLGVLVINHRKKVKKEEE